MARKKPKTEVLEASLEDQVEVGSVPTGGGNISKRQIFATIANRKDEILNELFDLAFNKKKKVHSHIRLGALKVLINKIAPDLRAIQHSGTFGVGRVLSDKEYEEHVRRLGIDPRTGDRLADPPPQEAEEGKI